MFKRNKKLVGLVVLMLVAAAFAVPTSLTPVVMKENNYAVQAGDLTVTETACDNVNGNSFPFTGREILLVHNTNAGGAQTFSITSTPDQYGRTGDIANYSIVASGIAVIDLDTLTGWKQTNGTLLLACNAATVKFVVLRLPG